MAEEDSLISSDIEVEAELKRIEDEMDAEPGFLDVPRIGQTMIILGTIGFVSYFMLTMISALVLASESWAIFNFWSTNRFLVVSFICLGMIIFGYILSQSSGSSIRNDLDN